jgi:hypothetical protein
MLYETAARVGPRPNATRRVDGKGRPGESGDVGI